MNENLKAIVDQFAIHVVCDIPAAVKSQVAAENNASVANLPFPIHKT